MPNGNGVFQPGDKIDVSKQFPGYRAAKTAEICTDIEVTGWFPPPIDYTQWLYVHFQSSSGTHHWEKIPLPGTAQVNVPQPVQPVVPAQQAIAKPPVHTNGAGLCSPGDVLDLSRVAIHCQGEYIVATDDEVLQAGFVLSPTKIYLWTPSQKVSYMLTTDFPKVKLIRHANGQPSSYIPTTTKAASSTPGKKCPRIGCPDFCGVDQMAMIEFTQDNPCPKCGFPGFLPKLGWCQHKRLRFGYDGKIRCMTDGCDAVFRVSSRNEVKFILRPNFVLRRLQQPSAHKPKELKKDDFLVGYDLKTQIDDEYMKAKIIRLEADNDMARAPVTGWDWK